MKPVVLMYIGGFVLVLLSIPFFEMRNFQGFILGLTFCAYGLDAVFTGFEKFYMTFIAKPECCKH